MCPQKLSLSARLAHGAHGPLAISCRRLSTFETISATVNEAVSAENGLDKLK